MRNHCLLGAAALALVALVWVDPLAADPPPARRLLAPGEREAVLALIKAVDLAQAADTPSDAGLAWAHHILKADNNTGYVPFRLTTTTLGVTSAAVYVRAVSRHDGVRSFGERSFVRDWLLHGSGVMPRQAETMTVGFGEVPTAGLPGASTRQGIAAAAAASAALATQMKDYEKQKRAADEARRKEDPRERDPLRFPFENYFFVNLPAARGNGPRSLDRALALPPGEYDVYVGLIDRASLKTSSPAILHETVTVPDFWNDELRLSSLILTKDVRTVPAAFSDPQRAEHPYVFGSTEVIPAPAGVFTTDEALTVVFQVCNYGAPDADLAADYTFYRVDGLRRLFNKTNTQTLSDEDLPPPSGWSTKAFASQSVPLQPFPLGQYELEVQVRDRLTRATAKATVAFTVASGLR